MELIRQIQEDYLIREPQNVNKYVDEFRNEDREFMIVLGLDTKNKVIYRDIISVGILNASLYHPRETFKSAIKYSANSIIFIHNHPSNDTTPSNEDIIVRDNIKQASEILGIKLLDFIIISQDKTVSYIN